ncbi:uncharacterized protein LOC128266311 [Drosophila gunungcola]|uniref:uncharacterized protein LOC128266311 n=1 Tax=Drosophila gunungcola TaxID=103775 RepID=UPI0022DED747|nr:uncharacterized protein LOC128266311 [Drosophila gunungcola]XP_052858711.1 uncharacterized protein LOC128266311 [Drosophila gunungcola]
MAHFGWLLKFGFLLLMLSGCWTRPAPFPGGRQSELIAGNEFLKLFLDHDDQQRSLHSSEQDFEGRAESPSSSPNPRQRSATGRSLDVGRNRYRNSLSSGNNHDEEQPNSKQVAKLVTSGSKIVFLEDAPNALKRKSSDEVKVVAVSVSSSSKRGPSKSTPSSATGSGSDFVNRSHKSELSIEETEPRLAADSIDVEGDSLNSASNIQSVLAAPLLAATSAHSFLKNQSEVDNEEAGKGTGAGAGLPFQTVIYHDTKQGRGPQSRSISYSSISQNVDDLQAWQQSRSGILAEAQRNVSESLKHGHSSEPAKFYSVPSKMYSVPSKFYSEPAKVYSEPAKMYGQPEKVYSEPSKVYGQPSKFYSEPSKVYSQPSKVYGEPAKTYWPQTLTTTAATPLGSTSSAPASTTSSSSTEKPLTPTTFVPLRSRPRPAIVSRIAFGEAQSTSTTTAATPSSTAATSISSAATLASRVTTVKPPSTGSIRPTTWQHHYHSYNHQQQQQQHPQQAHPTRRVLFNLDKLPYDLLNAPQPHPLEPILSKHSSPSNYHQQHQQQQQPHQQHEQQQQHQRPCWEQQRQHSSPPHQHSNQNAKRLPNRDLVKCVSKFAHQHGAAAASVVDPSPPSSSGSGGGYSYSSSSTSSSSSSSSSSAAKQQQQQQQQQHQHQQMQHFTTERPELYTPTSEQNYEIEESVSVMTNGRAHGLQGGAGSAAAAGGSVVQATTPASPLVQSSTTASSRGINRGRGSVVYNANANDYSDDDGDTTGGEAGDSGSEGPETPDDEDKVAYVVEGRNYRKYRVEEKTDDGFIVGEYGVVDHNDGNLWGVRYTADSTINRSLIQKALLTFLKLK